ncbi:ERCC4-related helicase [Catenulispora sp. EB89]|uniref:DEAD/DEAH box helicase n=1 Tax=Catenulispora sp. EB89 TaxID=3156257 RepID=UPI003511833D
MTSFSPTGLPRAIPSVAEAGALLTRCRRVLSTFEDVQAADRRFRERVAETYTSRREALLKEELLKLPLDSLRQVSESRLVLGGLDRAGIDSVGALLGYTFHQLTALDKVGPAIAESTLAAAARLADARREHVDARIDAESARGNGWPVVSTLQRCVALGDTLTDSTRGLELMVNELGAGVEPLRYLGSRVRRFASGATRRTQAAEAAARVEAVLRRAEAAGLLEALDAATTVIAATPPPRQSVLDDFERRAAEYQSLLGEIVGLAIDANAAHGYLPEHEVDKVERQKLVIDELRTHLRVYQVFGARFALQFKRVILGDEMGTGKTLQAIAAMAHLQATGKSHFLVICPTTVLINWQREIEAHSLLRSHLVHGELRKSAERVWIDQGGVAITTFTTARSLTVPREVRVAMLVVDEAHYVKNPHAKRSQNVREWTNRVDRVLFLTGTPMENRVEEFRNLVEYLQPAIAQRVTGLDGAGGARSFRRAVAPVYLRRNQEDVLPELPDEIRTDAWEPLGNTQTAAYRRAVLDGKFAEMRQVAYMAGAPKDSNKLRRLREIVQESFEDGRKVLVYSYYRDVLDIVRQDLELAFGKAPINARVLGPLNGSVPAGARQRLADEFTRTRGPAALVAQIEAGGTGLNLQAASVVVLCEPQLKPSAEEQAIARARRMGQVRRVTVHRLLTTESVDERLVEILREKQNEFDLYARHSDTADRYAAAKDTSEAQLRALLISDERHRVRQWADK